MAKRFFYLLLLCLGATAALAQNDSLIYAEGKIFNAATKEPITARITYQSLPYGNRVGTLNNSNYSFPMFDNEKYAIIVEAQGFATAKFMLDPAEANGERKVLKDIELSVGNVGPRHPVGHVMRLDNLIFQVSRSKISEDSFEELDLLVNMMRENPTMVIQLEGHTDYQGNPKDNMKLSQDRVDAVREYLIDKRINKNRIKTKAFGGTQPLSRDDTPEAHRLNRRVEVRILQS
ncbi:OmpA family protein [Pseudochryseolinea flava]|uniref:OmpA family protein n=1 Tax=Pseudochryseolinea flava TaxID=2059302 RepID=A0A364Y7X9_9BACT|nr:OmpA family protein [Pseudochryseolinea flava]RAW03224.1 OmpA family protein [Pseudochryseolinea flava]